MTYPIIFCGDNWLPLDRSYVLRGAELLGNKLATITKVKPEDAFLYLVGEIQVYSMARVKGGWDAYVSPEFDDRIYFKRKKVTAELAIHEYFHIINDNVPELESPADILSKHPVLTESGVFVTGQGRSGYARWGGFYVTIRNGYIEIYPPFMQHPKWWYKGNSAIEDWADMGLGWVIGNFAYENDAGRALNKFVTEYIFYRLEKCRKD